jgi:hypothetical protein
MSTASSPRRNPLNGIAPRCLSVVAVYALVLVVLFTVVDNMIASLYPSIETVEEHSSELQQDEFSRVAAALSAPSQIIVFDSEGNRLYSSSAEIAEEISPDDLDLIASGNDWFYEALLRTDESGSTWYEVSLCKNSDDGKSKAVLGTCLCDDDGTIVSGSLFPGRKRLSPRDLSLLQGNYGTDMLIDKYEYSNSKGRPGRSCSFPPATTRRA